MHSPSLTTACRDVGLVTAGLLQGMICSYMLWQYCTLSEVGQINGMSVSPKCCDSPILLLVLCWKCFALSDHHGYQYHRQNSCVRLYFKVRPQIVPKLGHSIQPGNCLIWPAYAKWQNIFGTNHMTMVAATLICAVIGLEQNMTGGYRYQNTFLCGDNEIKRMWVASLSMLHTCRAYVTSFDHLL